MNIREQIAAWKPMPDPEQYSDMGRLGWQGFWIHQRDALEARLATADAVIDALVRSAGDAEVNAIRDALEYQKARAAE